MTNGPGAADEVGTPGTGDGPAAMSTVDSPSDGPGPEAGTPKKPGGPVFWVGVVVGWTVIVIGIRGLLHNHVATNPSVVGRYVLEAALILDLVVAPIACLAGLLVSRLFKPPVRAIIGAGMVASVLVTIYSYPFVRGYGRSPNLPSALPVNYGRGLVIMLVGIWVVVGALCAWSLWRKQTDASQVAA